MRDVYIDGVQKLPCDSQITTILSEIAELGGKPMRFAIQNNDGDIYRDITVIGMGAMMTLVQALPDLGLVDILAEDMSPNKYDGIFVPKP